MRSVLIFFVLTGFGAEYLGVRSRFEALFADRANTIVRQGDVSEIPGEMGFIATSFISLRVKVGYFVINSFWGIFSNHRHKGSANDWVGCFIGSDSGGETLFTC